VLFTATIREGDEGVDKDAAFGGAGERLLHFALVKAKDHYVHTLASAVDGFDQWPDAVVWLDDQLYQSRSPSSGARWVFITPEARNGACATAHP
jgi:hypothetical protein